MGNQHDRFLHFLKKATFILLLMVATFDGSMASATIRLEDRNSLMALINDEGEVFLTSDYIYETELSYIFSNKQGEWGFYDKRSGYQSLMFDYVYDLDCTEENSPILVEKNGKIGYLNRTNGDILIPFRYIYIAEFSQFRNGYAVVGKEEPNAKDGRLVTLINEQGEEQYFPDGVMPVSFVYNDKIVIRKENPDGYQERPFYGLGDIDGRIVIEPQFDYIADFSEGYASFCYHGSWGHMDDDGKIVVPPTYRIDEEDQEGGYYFENGVAELQLQNGAVIWIDYAGNVIQ